MQLADDQRAARGGNKRSMYLLVACVLGALLLILALRGADLREAVRKIASANPVSLLLAAGIFSVASFVRSCRWRVLLSVSQPTSPALVFWVSMVGLAGNNFLPLRAGELVRSALIGISSGISKTYAIGTIVVERLADTVILLALVPLLLPRTLGLPPDFTRKIYWTLAILLAMAVLAVVLLRRPQLSGRLHRILPRRVQDQVDRMIGNFGRGLGSVLAIRRALMVLLTSMAAWLVDAGAAVVIASSMGLDLNQNQALTLLVLLGLSSALPSTPGYVGIYQFVAVTVLTPFRFSRNDALAYIAVFQGICYLQIVFWTVVGSYVFRDVLANWRLRKRAQTA